MTYNVFGGMLSLTQSINLPPGVSRQEDELKLLAKVEVTVWSQLKLLAKVEVTVW